MFGRLRRLHISLAAKCQMLFGAAVVLIIGAALFVPWQRMDALMRGLNVQAAHALVQQALAEHIESAEAAAREGTSMQPTAAARPMRLALARPVVPVRPASGPSTRPATEPAAEDVFPRLIGVDLAPDRQVTGFERRAIRYFQEHPTVVFRPQPYQRDGIDRYRYAEALYAEESCVRCHAAPSAAPSASQPWATTVPATSADAATLPAAVPLGGRTSTQLLGILSVDIPSQIDANQVFLNRVFILIAGLLAGTLAIAVFYAITTRLILQPVRVLQETAEKVSQGDLDIRSDISTGDEFQQLSETFNTMLANLKQGADQLRSINKSLDLKLGQLAESNVALYESNRLKSEFLANVSHELRTPLNSILGFAELLRDTSITDRETKPARYLQNILTSGRSLLELINDLLDLAKIEAGRMEVRTEPLSLGDVFEGLTNLLKPLAEQKGLRIDAAVEPGVPIVETDAAKLQQVLYNLMSNAIKFSPAGERVELRAAREPGDGKSEPGVRVSVRDRGPGVEPDKQAIIFEKFRQIDGSVTRAHSGTGLGLAISRELIALLGGAIGVDSTPGAGATFWVVLPLKTEAGPRDVRGRGAL